MRLMTELTNRNPANYKIVGAIVLILVAFAGFGQRVQANLFGGPEPLPVEQVFIPEIRSVSEQTIAVEFSIEDGYYLYRDKLAFNVVDVIASAQTESRISSQDALQTSGTLDTLLANPVETERVSLGPPGFAESVVMEDDYFGKQAIFRNSTVIDIPYTSLGKAQSLTLGIKYQGCADIGLCYPPTDTTLTVNLPATAVNPGSSALSAALLPVTEIAQSRVSASSRSSAAGEQPLADVLGASDFADDLLPPELAYLPQITEASSYAIDLNWFIEDGYYLYRDKLSFSLEHANGLQTAEVLVSEGREQHDEFFGNVMVLRQSADARIILANSDSFSADELAGTEGILTIGYQGCADIGVCFPPTETVLPVSFSADLPASTAAGLVPIGKISGDGNGSGMQEIVPGQSSATSAASTSTVASGMPAQSEQDRLFDLLGASSLWLTVATFFGLGLLLAFTPCVLPMIPILSSLIVGRGQSMTTGKAFQLSLVYVLVMASTYAAVGVVVGLSGYNVQAFLQSPAVLTGIAVLFVLLSLSMFGFYELQMPTGLQAKLTRWSNKQGSGQVGGVAAMGFISTLIVGPCVTAPLAGALIYIAKTGDAVIGGAALFALGLGMGAPLLLIGTSAGKFVPKAGAWMDATKHIFGILMLGMAIYMISRFLPVTVTMGLFGVLAVMSGVYLGATDSISRDSGGWQRFGKGAGLVVSGYGLALLVGALAGGGSYTAPLRALNGGNAGTAGQVVQNEHSLPFQRVKSVQDLQNVVAQAAAQGRPVMLDFYADWCISCKEMDAFTFSDGRVQELLSTAIVVQADVTANDADDQALLKEFELFGPPGIIFYDATGDELRAARVVGFMNADKFSTHIRQFIYSTDT